jgi:pyrroline-5-carboxylate reductase
MNIGIIGYGSMGKMILEKLALSHVVRLEELYLSHRFYGEKLNLWRDRFGVCRTMPRSHPKLVSSLYE